jgi:release factor glutamine methyltransferase
MDLRAALALAREQGLERIDAQLLLCHVLQCERAWLISHDDAQLSPAQQTRFEEAVAQRAQDVPLAYLIGEKEFHGLRLKVTPDTLVPRADTEVLVDWALELLAEAAAPCPQVVDLGTGTGAIALALKHRHPAADLSAVDLSAAALAVARENAQHLGLDVQFLQGNWWQPLAGRRFDLIVSNPPYIAGEDEHLPALRHEPLSALTPGGDGLSALRILVDGAPAHLQPGAWLLLEHGWDQAESVAAMLQMRGFEAVNSRRDLGGQMRVSGGRWPSGQQ